jgi:hypothetical protein
VSQFESCKLRASIKISPLRNICAPYKTLSFLCENFGTLFRLLDSRYNSNRDTKNSLFKIIIYAICRVFCKSLEQNKSLNCKLIYIFATIISRQNRKSSVRKRGFKLFNIAIEIWHRVLRTDHKYAKSEIVKVSVEGVNRCTCL